MELVERDEQLAELRRLADDLGPAGRVAVVVGEAGAGKSSLLTAFGRALPATVVFRSGRCDDLATPASFAPLWGMGETLPGSVMSALRGAVSRSDLFTALLDELRKQSSVLAIDDAQWADEATIDLLRYVGRRIADIPVLLCIAFRAGEVARSDPLQQLLGDLGGAVRRIALPPLSWAGVERLAAGRSVDLAGIYAKSRGNPFFVTELLATSEPGVPDAVSDAVLARAAALGNTVWTVLDAVALAPEGLPVAAVAGLGPSAEEDADAAVQRGLLEVTGGRLRCRHDLVREALAGTVPPVRRRRVHASLVELLADRAVTGADVAQVAHHAVAAEDGPRAVEFSVRAGDRAAADGAHREAARHYANTLRYASFIPDDLLPEVLDRYSHEAYYTYNMQGALDAALRLLELRRGDPADAGRTAWWCSRLAHFAGHRDQAIALAAEAVETLGDGIDPLGESYAQWWLATLERDNEALETWGMRTVELAREQGELGIAAHALNSVGLTRWSAGDPAGAAQLEDALHLAREGGSLEQTARVYNNLAHQATVSRRPADAERWFDEGLAWTSDQDLTFWRESMIDSRCMLRLYEGRWEDALEDVDATLSSSRATAVMQVCAVATRATILLRRGDDGAADAVAAIVDSPVVNAGDDLYGRAVEAEAAWLSGAAAAEDLARWAAGVEQSLPGQLWRASAVAFWLARIDESLLANIAPEAFAEPLKLELTGDLLSAVAAWLDLSSPFEAAVVRGRSEDPEQLRAAVDVLDGLGATATIAALRRDAAARGVRGFPRGRRRTTRANVHGLTARQAEVLALLAEGMTNAQIAEQLVISEKTAEHHVSAILTRLGATNRAQAAAIAREAG